MKARWVECLYMFGFELYIVLRSGLRCPVCDVSEVLVGLESRMRI